MEPSWSCPGTRFPHRFILSLTEPSRDTVRCKTIGTLSPASPWNDRMPT
jgi:hypothetical protein